MIKIVGNKDEVDEFICDISECPKEEGEIDECPTHKSFEDNPCVDCALKQFKNIELIYE